MSHAYFPNSSAFAPLHSNALLSTLHRQLNHPNTHPRLLRFHHNFFLPSNRRHDISVVIHIRALLAGDFTTPQPRGILLLRIVKLLLGKKLAVVLLRLNTVSRIVSFDAREQLVDLRIFAILLASQRHVDSNPR
jgi:hypothetical protein